MERKSVISPDAINILCQAPRQHPAQQRTAFEPMQTPKAKTEPEKALWERIKSFFKKATKLLAAITATVVGLAALFKGAADLRDRYDKFAAKGACA